MKHTLIVHLKTSRARGALGTCDASAPGSQRETQGWGGDEVRPSYLHFDQALHSLDLSFTEGPSVLGADVGPYSQVGWLIHRLQHTHTQTHTL